MTTYLLDTNVCIAVINGKSAAVRERFAAAAARRDDLLLSSIGAFELWYGVGKSQHRDANRRRVDAFLAGPLIWTPFDEEDAAAAGFVRAQLELRGTPIGAYDVLLAGQARRRGATLVTSNTRELTRVDSLAVEDWAAGS
jgi:tRNA(fMet)-specific endonuclease VapC